MYKVDLNSDLGESFGRYTIGNDDKIIPLISSANIACGFHASDPVVMTTAIEQTTEAGIQIGAHPMIDVTAAHKSTSPKKRYPI